jgi:hypothetical protein
MSIMQSNEYNGKVVSHISFTQPSPGGITEYSVHIRFDDGSTLDLKSQSSISIEKTIINQAFIHGHSVDLNNPDSMKY